MSYRCNNCGTIYKQEPEKCQYCGRMDFKQNACACKKIDIKQIEK